MTATAKGGAFETILCPVDFSPNSRRALQHATAIARRSKGRVTALYVNNPLLMAAAAAAYDERDLARTCDTELGRFIRQAVGPKGAPAVDRVVVMGEPAREIEKAAGRLGADLIVVGTHGLSGAGKWFFGSTTERVLRHATVAILAVPPSRRRGRASGPWPGKTALAAIDLGAEASSDAGRAAAVARGLHARLLLAYVVPPDPVPLWLSARLRVSQKEQLANARAALARVAAGLGTDLKVDVRVQLGDPADEIAALAAAARAGLIIVALRKGEGAFGAAQGSITYRILSGGCTVPVLALPGERRRDGAPGSDVRPDPSAFT